MKVSVILAVALAGCGAPGNHVEPKSNAAGIGVAAALAGTSWAVTAINGRATPGGPSYVLSFTDTEIAATFGCNSIGANYQRNGDHLSTSEMNQTEMGCSDPADTFERQGSGVLASNMRIEPINDRILRLVSEAGSIDLRRTK